MAKRRVGSRTANLTFDHKKSGIDPIYLAARGVPHIVGKLSTRATTLLQTAPQSEVFGKILMLGNFGHLGNFYAAHSFGPLTKVEESLNLYPNILGTLEKL